ncbi:membrane protein [Amycolatopsis deserti]|uniref:Membrane protein n=1 Tax=Amycolatopsis deserti TaxID=185696 RepID=A0ABQ3JH09_9PSEU|nr:DMT family transporter [Amycolatopsis deserti]GHF29627.1 membrane protein [Amycolatopsis deserti]
MGRKAIPGAGFVLFWSSGFVGATLGARSSGAVTLLAWRFIVVGLLLGAWWLVRRRSMRPRDVAVHAGLGVLSQGGYLYFTYAAADLGVPPGTTALIAALQPVAAVVLGQIVLGERAGVRRWVGLVAGLAGVALVVGGDLSGHPGTPALAYGLPFLAMLALVAATFLERRTAPDVPLMDGLAVQSVTSTVLFTGIAAATGQLTPPLVPEFWFAIGWVVVFSTFGGYGCYWLVLRRSSVTTVSTLLYLTPPTTMVLAWIMFGDTITLRGLLGLVVCSVAVVLVLRRPRKLSVGREMMAACSSPTSSQPPPR